MTKLNIYTYIGYSVHEFSCVDSLSLFQILRSNINTIR